MGYQLIDFTSFAEENLVKTMGLRWKRKLVIIASVIFVLAIILLSLNIRSSTNEEYFIKPDVSFGNEKALRQSSLHESIASKLGGGSFYADKSQMNGGVPKPKNRGYTQWPQFTPSELSSKDLKDCVSHMDYSITGLVALQQVWKDSPSSQCRQLYETFHTIFEIDGRKAPLLIPDAFKEKVNKWLANKEDLIKEVYNQDVIHVVNRYTREHTVFNPLRDKRPIMPPDIPEKTYLDDIVNKTQQTCDFCKYKDFTAEHTFGRVESKHSFSASNIFKLDTVHGILAPKAHHPLNWSKEQFLDLFELTLFWLSKAKRNLPDAKFPSLIWDVLPKCGASQVHPHLHVVFDPKRYHGEVESWRRGAQDYFDETGRNYFNDLVRMYSLLNLTVNHGNAVAFANLVPRKDHEIVIMSRAADRDFFTLVYFVLRGLVDDLGKMCFSMGMGLPPMGEEAGRIPAYARVITRGAITDIRSDISSLELFMAANVNIDPWKTSSIVRNSVLKRQNQ